MTNAVTLAAFAAGPAFSAYCGSSQVVSSGTTVKVALTAEEFDTNTCFNNTGSTVTLNGISVPSYSFAPNVAGYYLLTGQTENVTGGGPRIAIAVYKNGSSFKQGTDLGLPSGNWGSAGGITLGVLVYLNGSSDYVDMRLYDSGGQTIAAGPTTSYFQGFLVRPA